MAASKTTLVLLCFVLPAAIESEGYFKRHFEVGNVKIGRGDKTRGRAINRIVGGVEVTPHSHPYQVGLYIHTASGNFICGATLLSTKYVLTAAHCLDDADKIDVILGAHNIYDQDEIGQVRVSTGKFVQHENWTPSGFLNDIGVVELPVSVNLTESVSSVVLPRYSNVNVTFENRTGTVMGWGRISDEPWGVAEVLQSVNATVMSNERCKEVFDIVGDVHMCTSGDGIKGTCMGDSGGPLIVDGVQVGIVSFGSQYCELGFPSAYTRVTHFLHWISQNSDVQINP